MHLNCDNATDMPRTKVTRATGDNTKIQWRASSFPDLEPLPPGCLCFYYLLGSLKIGLVHGSPANNLGYTLVLPETQMLAFSFLGDQGGASLHTRTRTVLRENCTLGPHSIRSWIF